jgi:hypothetical protein
MWAMRPIWFVPDKQWSSAMSPSATICTVANNHDISSFISISIRGLFIPKSGTKVVVTLIYQRPKRNE